MSTLEPAVEQLEAATGAIGGATPPVRRRREWLYFALRNTKLVIGLVVVAGALALAVLGPWLTDADPFEFGYGTGLPPSPDNWLGTTAPGQDVFAQLVYGLRASFVVGAISATIASIIGMAVGFVAGYKGGGVDELLSVLTNVVLVIPTLAVLIIFSAYLSVRGLVTEAILIGLTSWPWAARAIRAQTFSLASRDFVSLARLSGAGGTRVIVREIAPNMASYLFLVFILLFGGSILIAAFLDFLGLGPTNAMSLGVMMNNAVASSALPLGMWWWFVPPGLAVTAVVGGLYVMNVGLDEIFNPRLRELMTVQVEDLKVHYRSLKGDVKALDGVTFAIDDGEIMGLAGESGCGKTTLGRSLIRLDGRMRHVGGRVTLDDVELPIWDDARMNPFRFKRVSIVPQYAMSALNPTRKVGRIAEDLLESRGVRFATVLPELKRRLQLVGLSPDVLAMYPIELSGGMKQRSVMVLSTLLDPSLLIADEITSALDVSTQRAVAETLVEFRDRAFVKSIIVITHDLSVLYQIADTILVMYAGRLAEKGPAETIVEAPLHPYTRLLIGSLPEVGVRHDERRLQGIPGRPPSLLNPPTGCRFRHRCPLAFEKCVEQPPFVEVEPAHRVACWATAPP